MELHSDERGRLNEVLRHIDHGIPSGGQLYVFTINPGFRRGDHYHTYKREWFTCVSGEAIVLVEDKEGNKKKILLSSEKPAVFYCGPYTSHALINKGDVEAVVVSYGSHQHDPDEPDTYAKFIEYGEDL
ncbi:MAG: WxcM-like domain-containing protein [Candidatus Pacebacteria bacterium]|nr:WxcM-like domain-containing protein [Candidatus Paceibacterota bacterium]